MMRLFVALAIPPEPAAQLAALAGGVPGARWVAARNLHLTWRVVGEVDQTTAETLHRALQGIRAPAFDLDLSGFGTFGGRKPHALWVGVAAHPALDLLQARVDGAARAAGLAPEGRKFTPHVTLAWLKVAPGARLAAFMSHHSPLTLGFSVSEFALYRSHLGAEGAEYEALEHYPLLLA